MTRPMIVSAADFVAEPRDLFETRLPSHLRGHCPHVFKHRDGGEGWAWATEDPVFGFGWDFVVQGPTGPIVPHWMFAEFPASAVDATAHLLEMDVAGVAASVVYPLSLLDGCRRLGPEIRRAGIAAYNRWVADEYEAVAPDRLIAVRVLPAMDAPWAVAREVGRILDAGGRAVLLPSLSPSSGEDQGVVWAALAEADLTVCVPALAGADGVQQELVIAEVLAAHPALRIVVAPVDAAAGETPLGPDAPAVVARLYDAIAPTGAPMYCANLPRQPLVAPTAPDEAGATAVRAFRFADLTKASRGREVGIRVRERLPIPSTVVETGGASSSTFPSIGLALSNLVDSGPMTARSLSKSAAMIEEAGFAGIWVGDVVARRPNMRSLDPINVLSVAAGATERVELGTCVLQVALRRRVELAHRLLSLHQLAQGRFMCGVGAGSTRMDFEAVGGVPFEERFRELREALPELKALWRGERIGDACLYPSEENRGGPPVLVGSWGGQWVERAARDGDGWIASGTKTWAALEGAIARFKAAGGTRAAVSSVFTDLTADDEPREDDDRVHLACSPAEAARRIQRLGDMGFTDVIVFNNGPAETLPELANLAAMTVKSRMPLTVA
jgi:alkanesulfonate monooxygenase SsuD/methylene tetrahydromethanopterin reductase-like flavin-dependent oxidoreductase (luciferase family)